MPTKAEKLEFIKEKLGSDERWAIRGLKLIFAAQTHDEQANDVVSHRNGVGFKSIDAKFLSSCAKQLERRGNLTQKQMTWVFKKMPSYAGQLMRCNTFDDAKLEKIMGDAI